MKIVDSILKQFKINDYDIKESLETLDQYTLTIETKKYFAPEFESLEKILLEIPSRDSIEITVEEIDLNLSEFNKSNYDNFKNQIDMLKKINPNQEKCSFKIKIYKKEYNRNISIYSLESFVCYLNNLSLEGILFNLNKILKIEPIVFKLQNDNFNSYTKSIYFIKENKSLEYKNTNNKDKKILKRNMSCSFLNASEYEFSPEDFYLLKRTVNKTFNDIFDRLCIIFSLIYISDISNIDDKDYLKCTLKGYRLIENKIKFNDIETSSQSQYYNIYRWIYSEENIEDKIGIARNVISLDIKSNNLLKISENLFNSIKSAHSIYLKENVEKYIEVKNKVTEFLFDMSQKSSELVDGLGKSFMNNIVAFVTYFFTIIIMNSLSSDRLDNIFTKDIVIISFLFLVLSFLYMLFSLNDVEKEKQRFKELYNRLKTSYEDILNENDINYIFKNDKYIDNDIEFIDEKVGRYKNRWIICLVIISISIIVG